jgi:site-specific DNA recombinase
MSRRRPHKPPAPASARQHIRCAIYTRKSSDEGLDQEFNSLDAQRDSAEAYIASQKAEGWQCLPERYDDGGFSGGSMERPALDRLLRDVKEGKIDCVVVYKVDRLSRSLLDFSRIMETFERCGVSFVSVTQHFNTTTSMGRLTLNILLSFAQFEREIIGERIRDKLAAQKRKGKWTGGMPVLGYDVDRSGPSPRLVVNSKEAFRVREIFKLYLEHESLLKVVSELDRRGWLNKKQCTKKGKIVGGRPFDKATLYVLLTNPILVGKIAYKGEVYEGEHEAIIDAEAFNRVQTRLRTNGRAGSVEARTKYAGLLRGILRCKGCESGMTHTFTGPKNGRAYRYYRCIRAIKRGAAQCNSGNLPAQEIERVVINEIRALPNALSRVSHVSVAAYEIEVSVAEYHYLGLGHLVGTELLEPEVRLHLFENATGGNYPDLDPHNRVKNSRWTSYKGSGTRDFYLVEIAWDEASNITSVIDQIHKTTGGSRLFDAIFGLDGLDRLQSAKEGHLSGGSIQGTPTRFEEWTLSQTGNWLERQVDLAGSTVLTEDNTFSNANELRGRDTNQGTFTFAYNKVGHQTHDGEYDFVFDVFGRLRFVKRGEAEDVIVEYRYNGLGFRIAERGLDDEGEPGPWRYFAYDERWRIVAEFIEDIPYPESVYVHHAAGLDGHGGSSYIDSLILRDRSPGGEEVRDERRYYCQNWRSDVSVILTDDGSIVEWVKYTPYGEPIAVAAGDTDGDSDWDADDQTRIEDFITSGGTYDVRFNPTLTGTVDYADIAHANSITGGYQTLGRGVLSSEGVQNRFGYAGYRYDHHLAGADRHLYHVRHRVFQAHIGRWMTRDPLGYVDGMSLYQYVQGMALIHTDPSGLLPCWLLKITIAARIAAIAAVITSPMCWPVPTPLCWITLACLVCGLAADIIDYWANCTRPGTGLPPLWQFVLEATRALCDLCALIAGGKNWWDWITKRPTRPPVPPGGTPPPPPPPPPPVACLGPCIDGCGTPGGGPTLGLPLVIVGATASD